MDGLCRRRLSVVFGIKVTKEEYTREHLRKQENERLWDDYTQKKWKFIIAGTAIYALNILDAILIMRNARNKSIGNFNKKFQTSLKCERDKAVFCFTIRF